MFATCWSFEPIRQFKPGDYVHYCWLNRPQVNGRVKRVKGDNAFVVYHCNEQWDDYENYTAPMTPLKDLRHGWVDKDGNPIPTPDQKQEDSNANISI